MTRICIIYFSQFKGATEKLGEAIARGAATVPEIQTRLIRVEDVDDHWADLHAADAIVFGTPTYMGSIAEGFKVFVEKLAGEVWLKRLWVNKVAAGFTVSAGRSGDRLNCLQQLVIFAAQMGMIWVPVRITVGNYSSAGSEADLNRMAGYIDLMAQANIDEPVELAPPPSDIETAEMHGHHVARVARQYALGRRELAADYDTYATTAIDAAHAPAALSQLMSERE